MSKKISRRTFAKLTSTAAFASTMATTALSSVIAQPPPPKHVKPGPPAREFPRVSYGAQQPHRIKSRVRSMRTEGDRRSGTPSRTLRQGR